MSDLRRRYLMIHQGGGQQYDADSYIQNGLVFQLDGIDKGSNTGYWTDRKGGINDGDRGDGNARRHLDRRVKSVKTVERAARNGNADHRQHRARREHTAEMGGAAGGGDDDLKPALLGGAGIFQSDVGRAVRRDDARFIAYAEPVERLTRLFDERPVRIRPHHDTNFDFRHFLFSLSI